VRRSIDRIGNHLQGRKVDLSSLRLDFEGLPDFHRRVYEAARGVRPGSTVSYGGLADRAGAPGAARAVGQAMARNPFPVVVPCHRVLASGGRPGGFSAHGGLRTKARLLGIEGVAMELRWSRREAVATLRRRDRRMAAIIREQGPFRLRVGRDGGPYEALLKAIVYQQLTNKAAHAILTRLRRLFDGGTKDPSPRRILRSSDEKLRSAGLSRAKAAAIRDLAARAVDGTVPTMPAAHGMSDDELIDRLTGIRGVGRWTVEMFLIFRLGRPDVLPVGDYALRDGFATAYGRPHPSPREFEKFGERWRPYRTVASWYLWEVCGR
jgi:methylated-DNA-[protein]-cysteine S-methyltransferase